MRGRTSNIKIELTPESRDVLQGLLRRQKIPAGLAKRARAILLLADGQTFTLTSLQVGMGERNLSITAGKAGGGVEENKIFKGRREGVA